MKQSSLDTRDLLKTLSSNTQHCPPKVLASSMGKQFLQSEITSLMSDSIDNSSPGLLD
jgi:hypothetical protein